VGAAAASLLSASPALAKPTPPPPAEAPATASFCPEGTVTGVQQPDGSVIFGVEANGAGCVLVQTMPGGIGLLQVIAAPGWTWTFGGGGGGGGRHGQGGLSGKVEVQFEQESTGRRVEVRVEPGRTEVK
jgi:hypothetical protein